MTADRTGSRNTSQARMLRKNQTNSEGLLWCILRARQLCGLKFRRQHLVGRWITDFACPAKMLVVEVDGGYHEQTVEDDLCREKGLRQLGWTVLRFRDEDIKQDAEAVGRAIARALGVPYEFKKRAGKGAGMKGG